NVLATAIIVGLIIYGSLFPFSFHARGDLLVAIHALADTWSAPPIRGDFIANILEYAPFGLFAMRSLQRSTSTWKYLFAVIVIGAAISTSLELTQFFVHGRYAAAEDVYANVLGVSVGAITAQVERLDLRGRTLGR